MNSTPPLPLVAFPEHVQRERALVALFDDGQKKRFAWRAARLYGFGIFVSYALLICLASGAERGAVIQGLIHAALVALSLGVGAPAALGAARDLAEQTDRDALGALAAQRGFSERSWPRARLLAAAARITRLVALPALLLVLVAVLRGATPLWALATLPALLLYALALGLGLALLALFSAEISAHHARAVLLALVLVPRLLSELYPSLPNLFGLYSGLLARLLGAGARLT